MSEATGFLSLRRAGHALTAAEVRMPKYLTRPRGCMWGTRTPGRGCSSRLRENKLMSKQLLVRQTDSVGSLKGRYSKRILTIYLKEYRLFSVVALLILPLRIKLTP